MYASTREIGDDVMLVAADAAVVVGSGQNCAKLDKQFDSSSMAARVV